MLNDVETGFYVSQCKIVLIFVPNQMNVCWVLTLISLINVEGGAKNAKSLNVEVGINMEGGKI